MSENCEIANISNKKSDLLLLMGVKEVALVIMCKGKETKKWDHLTIKIHYKNQKQWIKNRQTYKRRKREKREKRKREKERGKREREKKETQHWYNPTSGKFVLDNLQTLLLDIYDSYLIYICMDEKKKLSPFYFSLLRRECKRWVAKISSGLCESYL